jgi:gluconokinase
LNGVSVIVIVMGVVGAGKTTIGSLLAQQLEWEFADADSFHSASSVEKIRRGVGLDDADRAPWLNALHDAVVRWTAEPRNVVLACSALKRIYREEIGIGPGVKLVHLKGSPDVIAQRLRLRHGHFADEQILGSQLATLEEPCEEDAIAVDVGPPPEVIVAEIRRRLELG